MNELGEYAVVESRQMPAGLARVASRVTMVVLLGAFVLAGCGDDELFRSFPEQTAQPEGEPDAGAQADGQAPQQEDLEAWYDSQEEIIAPWAHELEAAAIDDALIEDDRISWPLPEYDHMKAWAMHDLLWSPVSDPSRAFLRRVIDIAVTDSHIVFQTRNAGLDEVYFKSHLEVETNPRSFGAGQQPLQPGEFPTRSQELKVETNNHEVKFALPKRRFGFCTKAGGSGFEPCQSAATSCPTDYEDTHNLCDSRDAQMVTGGGIVSKPMSAEVSFGTYFEFEPRIQFNFYRLYLVVDFNGWGDEDSAPCNCITRYYDTDVDQVARRCGMSSGDVVDWKAECSGAAVFANMEIAGGLSFELHDLKWKVNKTTTISKKFQLFQSLPIPIAAGIGVTLDAAIPLTFNLETLGEMSWENAANGPRLGFDFGFGTIQPAGPNGRLYALDIPDNNSTSLPAPQLSFGGKVSASAGLEVGALIGFAGAVGAKISIGGKAEAGVSAGVNIAAGTPQSECIPYFSLGGTLDGSLVADFGVWERSATWPIFNTCAAPRDNLFDLDMRAACLSWGGDNLCNNVYADNIRLVARDQNVGGTTITSTGERVDPAGIEIDAIYVVRGSGDNQEIIEANFVQGNLGASANIGTIGFQQCAHGSTWEQKVENLEGEMVVGFEKPLQPGDKVRIFRQGFPLNQGGRDADGNVVYCRPSGTFDVYVGAGGTDPISTGQWGQVAAEELEPSANVHDVNLSLHHFPN